MADEKDRFEQAKEYNEFLMNRRSEIQKLISQAGMYWFNFTEKEKNTFVFGPARSSSILNFLKKLTLSEILEAMDIAHGRRPASSTYDEPTWKYFCGICWRRIKGDSNG